MKSSFILFSPHVLLFWWNLLGEVKLSLSEGQRLDLRENWDIIRLHYFDWTIHPRPSRWGQRLSIFRRIQIWFKKKKKTSDSLSHNLFKSSLTASRRQTIEKYQIWRKEGRFFQCKKTEKQADNRDHLGKDKTDETWCEECGTKKKKSLKYTCIIAHLCKAFLLMPPV